MPSLKEVRGRIISVNSTQQITKAMKMVSAAKLRRAQESITRFRPYAEKLNTILANLSASLDQSADNPYGEEREVKKALIVVITSDRGLAGPFNSNIAKAVNSLISSDFKNLPKENITLLCIGKKGYEYFSKRGINNIIGDYSTLFHNLSFGTARPAAELAMEGFLKGEYDRVDIVYNEFKNAATQIIRKERLLPIEKKAESATKTANVDYIFEPSKEEILSELIPKSLKTQFYKALLESNASEHGARMSAMDKATENAKELLKELRLTYNRSRQAAITKEILEIVGGAEALAG